MATIQPIDGVLLVDGLMITGTHPECGKTVVTAGLAASIIAAGGRAQAFKPLELGKRFSRDQDYLDRMLKPLQRMESLVMESPNVVTATEWARILHNCRTTTYPCLIETPGSVASPLSFHHGQLRDATHLARELGTPVVLVTNKSPRLIANIAPAIAYLQSRQVSITGWIGVETRSTDKRSAPHWNEESLFISQEYQVPFLGEIPFSPSISVEAGHPGNLQRLAEGGIDLLPIQMAMRATVP